MNIFHRLFSPLATLLICLVLSQTRFFPWLADTGMDVLFSLRGPQPTSQSIVIIGIDELSLEHLGPWPFPRDTHAKLLKRLELAKAVGFDLLFQDEDAGDELFLQAMKKSPPVSLAVAENYQGELLKPPAKFDDVAAYGHIEAMHGKDGIVRRVELTKMGLPVISLAMLQQLDREQYFGRQVEKTLIINFYGPEFTFLYVSYLDVFLGKIDPDFFRDRFVMVGSQALALGDVHITPYSIKHPVHGVEVQATILNNLLEDDFIHELYLFACGVSFLFLTFGVWAWPQQGELTNIARGFLMILTILGISLLFFHRSFFVDPLLPIFILVVAYGCHLLSQWLWITNKLVAEIKRLHRKIDEGVERVFTTIPENLVRENPTKIEATIDTVGSQLENIHNGIEMMAVQNRFINHLLSDESPPLALWQEANGELVLASSGFKILWQSLSGNSWSPPELHAFFTMLQQQAVNDSPSVAQQIESQQKKNNASGIDIGFQGQGRKKYFRVQIHNVDSSLLGFTGVFTSIADVTEIRELERIKSEMMNIVSHELKLPLTTIMGYSEMLSDVHDGQARKYAIEICNQSRRLGTMIEEFLSIERIESGRYVINKYPFDLLTICHEAILGVKFNAELKEIVIETKMPVMVSPLLGDEALITQALLNLLDNAVKFSARGGKVLVEVSEAKEQIHLQVKDEGAGIAEQDLEQIFKKFVRGIEKDAGIGFGLGLSFAREVVESHGGTISAANRSKGGAVFTIVFPKVL